jgi:AraC family transcriptional regulator
VVFHPAGEPHEDAFERTGARCFNVELGAKWAARAVELDAFPRAGVAANGGPMEWIALQLRRELRHPDDVSALAVEGWVLALLAEASRARRHHEGGPAWLRAVRAQLHDRFAETLTLDELAAGAAVHPVHLARTFRRWTGSSIGEYVRRLRIEWACRELLRGDVDLAALAVACGFSSQSNFTRAFRAITGTTPAAYRSRRS